MKVGTVQNDAEKAAVIQRLAQETLALIIQVLATCDGLFDLGGLHFEPEATVHTATEVIVITAHFKSKLISYPRLKGVVAGSTFSPNDEDERYRYAAYALYRRAPGRR